MDCLHYPGNNLDGQLLNNLIRIMKKEKTSDVLGFLLNCASLKIIEEYFCQINLNPPSQLHIQHLYNVLNNILSLDFNKNNLSLEEFVESRMALICKIKAQVQGEISQQFLKFLVHLTAIDNRFIQCGSNSLNLLVELRAELKEQSFEDIRIKDTSLVGANFARSNLSGSEFDNVDISGMNLSGAILFNCKWRNLRVHELNKLDGHSDSVVFVCFSPDGSTLASGSYDNSIRLWDVKTGQQKGKLNGSLVSSVCFSPDGFTLASGSFDNSIRLWDVQTGQSMGKLDGHTSYVNSVCFSPDGSILASGSYDNSIRLWDVKTGEQKVKLDGHTSWVLSVCFSPDGSILSSGSRDESIRLWDVKTGQQKRKLDGHSSLVYSVCFSPDGSTLASGGFDSLIRFWDVNTGQQKGKLEGHTSLVISVCFSPDGSTLASGSFDNSICLWDVKTGQKKGKLDGHTGYVNSVCFSPDSSTLASGSLDNSIRLWDVQTCREILTDSRYAILRKQLSSQELSTFSQYFAVYITVLQISQNPQLLIQGALILRSEFITHQGINLNQSFQCKGCFLADETKQKEGDNHRQE